MEWKTGIIMGYHMYAPIAVKNGMLKTFWNVQNVILIVLTQIMNLVIHARIAGTDGELMMMIKNVITLLSATQVSNKKRTDIIVLAPRVSVMTWLTSQKI